MVLKKEKERKGGTCRLHLMMSGHHGWWEKHFHQLDTCRMKHQQWVISEDEVSEWVISSITKGPILHHLDLVTPLIMAPTWSGGQIRLTSKNTTPLILVGIHAYKGCRYSFHGLSIPYIFDLFTKSVTCTIPRDTRGEHSSFFPHATHSNA